MTIRVFGKIDISVEDTDIEKFKILTPNFEPYTAEYLILCEGLDETASKEEMEQAVKRGIEFDVYMRTHSLEETSEAIRKGIIH